MVLASLYFPEGVSAQGNESLLWVPAITTTGPKMTEINAAGSLLVTCALVTGFQPGSDQSSSEDTRMCSTQVFQVPGRISHTVGDLDYVYYPQAIAAAEPKNLHYETLVAGAVGYFLDRRGLAAGTSGAVAWAIGQKVDIYPVQLGDQSRRAMDPTAEGEKFRIVQKVFVTAPVVYDAIIVA